MHQGLFASSTMGKGRQYLEHDGFDIIGRYWVDMEWYSSAWSAKAKYGETFALETP
jgi:hypothetical protein